MLSTGKCFSYLRRPIATRRPTQHRNGAAGEDEKGEKGEKSEGEQIKKNNIKIGEPRFKMSGPLADMVAERLRKRNEL